MTRDDMLARLLAQAEGDGADLVTLRAIVEEAADTSRHSAIRSSASAGTLSRSTRNAAPSNQPASPCATAPKIFAHKGSTVSRHSARFASR